MINGTDHRTDPDPGRFIAALLDEHRSIDAAIRGVLDWSRRAAAHGEDGRLELRGIVGYLRHFVERCHFIKEERYLFDTAVELGLGGVDLEGAVSLHTDARRQVRVLHDLSTELRAWSSLDHRRLTRAASALHLANEGTRRVEEDLLFPRIVARLTAPQRREIGLRMAAFAQREFGRGELERHLAMGSGIAALAEAGAGDAPRPTAGISSTLEASEALDLLAGSGSLVGGFDALAAQRP